MSQDPTGGGAPSPDAINCLNVFAEVWLWAWVSQVLQLKMISHLWHFSSVATTVSLPEPGTSDALCSILTGKTATTTTD